MKQVLILALASIFLFSCGVPDNKRKSKKTGDASIATQVNDQSNLDTQNFVADDSYNYEDEQIVQDEIYVQEEIIIEEETAVNDHIEEISSIDEFFDFADIHEINTIYREGRYLGRNYKGKDQFLAQIEGENLFRNSCSFRVNNDSFQLGWSTYYKNEDMVSRYAQCDDDMNCETRSFVISFEAGKFALCSGHVAIGKQGSEPTETIKINEIELAQCGFGLCKVSANYTLMKLTRRAYILTVFNQDVEFLGFMMNLIRSTNQYKVGGEWNEQRYEDFRSYFYGE